MFTGMALQGSPGISNPSPTPLTCPSFLLLTPNSPRKVEISLDKARQVKLLEPCVKDDR